MTDRLTHQEMKRDPLAENVERSYEWLATHLKTILWTFAGLVALTLVVVMVWLWRVQQSEKAVEALGQAETIAAAPAGVAEPEPANATNPSFADETARREAARAAFQGVVDEYGGSESARVARLYLGRLAAEDGDSQRARELWHEVAGTEDTLSAQAWLNLLALDRAEGRHDEALEELEEMRGGDSALPGDVVLYELAQTYEAAGRSDEATQAYQEILQEYPESGYRDVAQQRSGAAPGAMPGMQGFPMGS